MRGRDKKQKFILGFSLLEVLVALALLAVSFSSLILVQGRATSLAIEARNISLATQLTRMKLLECKNEVRQNIAAVSDFNSEGDFKDLGYENFRWECHAPRFNMKNPSASQLEEGFKDKAPEGAKKEMGAASSISSPLIAMITDTLGNCVRELAVIVRWTDGGIEDEVRVVTHVIDTIPMAALSRMLAEGAKALDKSKPKKDEAGKPSPPGGPASPQPPTQDQ